MVIYKKSLLIAFLLASCGIVQSMSMQKTRDKEDQDQKALIARYQQAQAQQGFSLPSTQSRSRSYTSTPKQEVVYAQATTPAIQKAVAQKIDAQEVVKKHDEVKTEQAAPQSQNAAAPARDSNSDHSPNSWRDEIDDAQRNIRHAQTRLEKSVKLKHSIEKGLSANDTTAIEHLHGLLQQAAPASAQRAKNYEKDIGNALILHYELQLEKSKTSALQKHLPQDVDCWSVHDIDQLEQQLHSVKNQEKATQLDAALLITDHQIQKEKITLLQTEAGKNYTRDLGEDSSEAINQAIQDGIPFLKGTHDQLQNYRNENQQIRGKLYSKVSRIKFFVKGIFGYGKEEKKELQDSLRDSDAKLNEHENYFKELLKEKLILEQLHEDAKRREETEGGNGPGGGGSPRGPRPQLSDEAYQIGNNNIIGKAVALGIAGYVLYEASPVDLGQFFKKLLARLGQLADKLASCLSQGAEFTVQDFEDLLRQHYELIKLKEHYSVLKGIDAEAAKKYAEIEQALQGTSALIDSFVAGFKKSPEYDRLKDCIAQFGASELGILNKHANEVYRQIEALRVELNKLAAQESIDQEGLRQLKLKEEELRLHEEALQDCLNKKFIIENLGSISQPARTTNYGLIAGGAIAGGYLVNLFLKKGQGQHPYGLTQEEIDIANAVRAFAQAHASSGSTACSFVGAGSAGISSFFANISQAIGGLVGGALGKVRDLTQTSKQTYDNITNYLLDNTVKNKDKNPHCSNKDENVSRAEGSKKSASSIIDAAPVNPQQNNNVNAVNNNNQKNANSLPAKVNDSVKNNVMTSSTQPAPVKMRQIIIPFVCPNGHPLNQCTHEQIPTVKWVPDYADAKIKAEEDRKRKQQEQTTYIEDNKKIHMMLATRGNLFAGHSTRQKQAINTNNLAEFESATQEIEDRFKAAAEGVWIQPSADSLTKFDREWWGFGNGYNNFVSQLRDAVRDEWTSAQETDQAKAALEIIYALENAREQAQKEKEKPRKTTGNEGAKPTKGIGTNDEGKAGEKEQNLGAQAPGKPTAEDGYIPPKNWNGEKVKTQRGYGYPDKHGNIWIPTGLKGHGGPHWDVQLKGGGYQNVYPGGKIRAGKK